jgi:ATP-dependent helicase HrpA
VPDPRERPFERMQAADQAHLRFRDERSDFLSLIALWEFFAGLLAAKSPHRKLVDACRAQFVSYLRLREWRDVHQQLVATLQESGWKWSEPLPGAIDKGRYALLHQALLAGLLGNIGVKAEADAHYLGARGLKFHLHPGSGLARKSARWVLAAELTETSRLYARCAAAIEPEWIEQVAGDRVTRDHFDPHWEERRGEVVGSERVSLYGLTLAARRPVSYGRVDPAAARDIFIREGLVPGKLATRGAFLARNRQLIAEVAELEHKARRQDVLVDDEVIAQFYAERIPADVCTTAAFEVWRATAERADADCLHLTREYLMRHAAREVTAELFPEELVVAQNRLPLKYRFAPGHPLDGLTLTVPLALLNQVDEARLSWLVPGMIRDKAAHYLKALPKPWRNRLIPLGEVVTAFLDAVGDATTPAFPDALRAFIRQRLGEAPPSEAWDGMALPAHFAVNVVVCDAAGRELAAGRDLPALKAQLREAAQMSLAPVGPALAQKGLVRWSFGDLPESLSSTRDGQRLVGYPTLVDDGDSVSLAMLDTPQAARRSLSAGVIRLLHLALKPQVAALRKNPRGFAQAALQLKTAIPTDRLLDDAMAAVCDRAFLGTDPLPRTEDAFAEQVKRARTRLPAVADGAFALLASIAAEHAALTQLLSGQGKAFARIAAEVRGQRDALVYPGFMSATPWAQLQHLPRYLQALARRLNKYAERPDRDAQHAAAVAALWERFADRRARYRSAGRDEAALAAYRWLLEELRVSLFAQELKTPLPVSFKRVEKAWAEVEREG